MSNKQVNTDKKAPATSKGANAENVFANNYDVASCF